MKDSKGFTVVGLLVLLPFLISLVVAFAAAMLLLRTDAQLKHECRSTLLDAQNEIAEDLESLMKLNDEATSLRRARATAETAAKFPGPPGAAARAALAVIVTKQLALAARQAALIFRAKTKSRSTPLKTKLKLHQALRSRNRLIDSQRPVNFESSLRSASFEVVATPPASITPNYSPAPGFSESQEMRVEAEWSVESLLPDWLRDLLGTGALKMKTTCRATIAKGVRGWRSLLKTDKS